MMTAFNHKGTCDGWTMSAFSRKGGWIMSVFSCKGPNVSDGSCLHQFNRKGKCD